MSGSNQPPNACTSSQPQKPSSLFAWFRPVPPPASSPSERPNTTPVPSGASSSSTGSRSQSVQSEGTTKSNSKTKGSRPGRVAQPGAGLAALKRMATAPAALPAQAPLPFPISHSNSNSRLEPTPSTSSDPLAAPVRDTRASQDTPKRVQKAQESSPTPRGLGRTVSSPSQRLPTTRRTPLAANNQSTASSSTPTRERIEDSDPESAQQRLAKIESLTRQTLDSQSTSRRADTPPASSDEGEIVVSSRASSSAASSRSSSTRKKKLLRASATPSSARKTSTTARKPSATPSKPPPRSVSKTPSIARPSPTPPTRSSARIRSRSQSVEAGQPQQIPRLSFTTATSVAHQSTTEESTDSQSLRPRSTAESIISTPRKRVTVTRSDPSPRLELPGGGGGGPSTPNRRFQRDPSGSPLSELAPSPVKPSTSTSTSTTPKPKATTQKTRVKSETWKRHAFELVVEVPASKWRRGMRAGSMRRERETATSEYTDRPSEVDEMQIDGSQRSGDEATDEGERKRRSRPSRTITKPNQPERARRTKPRIQDPESESESSSSSEEEEEKKKSTTKEEPEEEEEEDVMAALARARARVASGKTLLVTSPEVSTSSTAPTTASPAFTTQHKDDTAIRRTKRVSHQTDRYSPTVVVASSSRGGGGTVAPLFDAKGKGKAKSDADFERMMRELQAKEKKGGRGSVWYENEMRLADKSDDDLDASSGESGDDLPDLRLDHTKHLDTLAQGIAGAVSEDDLLSPDKLAHKRRAKEVASILGDEEKKKAKAGLAGETSEERQARTIWKDSHRYEVLNVDEMKGEGWIGEIAKAIKDGLKVSQSFPSSILLCSRIQSNESVSSEDRKLVLSWLISLICHPDSPLALVEKLLNLFHRLVQLASHSQPSPTTPLFDAAELVQQLVLLGADPNKLLDTADSVEDEKKETEDDSDDDDDLMDLDALKLRSTPPPRRRQTKALTTDARATAGARWCRVIQILSSTPSVLETSAIGQLAQICVKLALDPTSAVLRGPLERTLVSLLHSPLAQNDDTRHEIFRRLALLYRSSRPRTQVEVLQAIPHQSSSDKLIRKWLAWAFLADEEPFSKITSLTQSLLPLLLDLVRTPPPSSAFNPPANLTDSSNDIKLFQQATLLLLSFTDLDDQLNVGDEKTKGQAQDLVESIMGAVKKIDGKLLADARRGLLVERLQAKNLLTSITNSLDYQLRRSRNQGAKFDLVEEIVDPVDGEGEGEKERDAHKDKKVRI
ncbi:uncharacterized protein JCM6883_000490 [Sporobolomyces salmoneus]|uniref:uncharacterized protein n=1 Tax=Sporobolomyces salmoneus TaxID=183962 RepID=UPI00317945CE